ncbi:hypothetical protein SPAN111604_12035 [Sphingomonas antarctica]
MGAVKAEALVTPDLIRGPFALDQGRGRMDPDFRQGDEFWSA